MLIEYHELRGLLQNNLLKILFVKRDGSEREMYCTLMPETIEKTFLFKAVNNAIKKDIRTIAVYDTEKNVWRSIVVENIISYSVVK
jgi:hypothetical protein